MENTILNKVAESSIVSLDLETYFPAGEITIFDLKAYLFRGLILKEKEFRTALTELDWEIYRGKTVGITCSADAIVPMWAYMLVATYLQPIAQEVLFGDEQMVQTSLLVRNLSAINGVEYASKRVVVKGCGDRPIPEAAYVEITNRLMPHVKSIMYGEPCSTVPIFKRKLQAP